MEQTVFSMADWTYDGAFALPGSPDGIHGGAQGEGGSNPYNTGPQYGQLTGRIVGGQVRLLMTGQDDYGDPVFEVTPPGSLSADAATAISTHNRATLVTWWGDIYNGKRDYALEGTNSVYAVGLRWYNNKLWWMYRDSYAINTDDPCLGFSTLDTPGTWPTLGTSTAYGPWRPTPGGTMSGGYLHVFPSQFLTHPDVVAAGFGSYGLGSGGTFGSGGSAASYGIVCYQFAPEPGTGTTVDTVSPVTNHVSVNTLAEFTYTNRQPMTGMGLVRKVDTPGGLEDNDGTWGPVGAISGPSVSTVMDYCTSVEWINWNGKQGVIFGAQLTDSPAGYGINFNGQSETHAWYSTGGAPCVHGQDDPINPSVTGPKTPGHVPAFLVYDQRKFVDVVAGRLDKLSLLHDSMTRAHDVIPSITLGSVANGTLNGLWWDSTNGKLYVVERNIDGTFPFGYKSVIHRLSPNW